MKKMILIILLAILSFGCNDDWKNIPFQKLGEGQLQEREIELWETLFYFWNETNESPIPEDCEPEIYYVDFIEESSSLCGMEAWACAKQNKIILSTHFRNEEEMDDYSKGFSLLHEMTHVAQWCSGSRVGHEETLDFDMNSPYEKTLEIWAESTP